MYKKSSLFLLGFFSLFICLSGPTLALDNAPPETKTEKEKLEGDGYKCKYLSPRYVECTKAGETKQWCDSSGKCEEVARDLPSIPPRTTFPVLTRPVFDSFHR